MIKNPVQPQSCGIMGTSVLIRDVISGQRSNCLSCLYPGTHQNTTLGSSIGSFSHTNTEHRPLTLKVDEDDEVIVLEVITPPEVKVLDEVPPAP